MTRLLKLIALATLAFCLGACATASGPSALGDATDASLKHDLVAGVTTMDDARKEFGDPTFVDLRDNGDTQWAYIYRKTEAFGVYRAMFGSTPASAGETRLTLDFDKAEKLKRYALSHD